MKLLLDFTENPETREKFLRNKTRSVTEKIEKLDKIITFIENKNKPVRKYRFLFDMRKELEDFL